MKSIGKNVTSSSRASFIEKEEEEEEKQLLLQNLISLLQVPKVKETEELLLATNDTILNFDGGECYCNGTMTMDMDPSFLGFAFSSLLELASGTKKKYQPSKDSAVLLKVVLELVRFVKHKVSTLAFFLPGIVSAQSLNYYTAAKTSG